MMELSLCATTVLISEQRISIVDNNMRLKQPGRRACSWEMEQANPIFSDAPKTEALESMRQA